MTERLCGFCGFTFLYFLHLRPTSSLHMAPQDDGGGGAAAPDFRRLPRVRRKRLRRLGRPPNLRGDRPEPGTKNDSQVPSSMRIC